MTGLFPIERLTLSLSLLTSCVPIFGVVPEHRSSVDETFGSDETIQFMKRQYQPSKIRRKRQHGFMARKGRKSGRAILRNRRRVGRKRLTPV